MEGACSCGEITVKVPAGLQVGMCHCVDCRKAGGNTSGISVDLPKGKFQMTGTPNVYSVKGMSGKDIRRYFCGTCGSPIYVECDLDRPEREEDWTVSVKIGLFPPKTIPKPSKHLFAKDMEDWESPVDGAEVLQTQ